MLQRRGEMSRRHDILGAARPPTGNRVHLGMPADDPQIREAEVFHHARNRADVASLARLDENDAESGAGCRGSGVGAGVLIERDTHSPNPDSRPATPAAAISRNAASIRSTSLRSVRGLI